MPRPERFLLFIVFMASVLKLSYNSIRAYATGIKSLWMRDGMPDPSMRHGIKRHRYILLMKGIRRVSCARAVRSRVPLTKPKLKRLLQVVVEMDLSYLEKLRFKAALLVSFFGLLRASNICATSKCKSVLRRSSIRFIAPTTGKKYILASLSKSKTSQFAPVKIYIHANSDILFCPYNSLLLYMNASKHVSADSSLLYLPGNPFVLAKFNALLKTAAGLAGWDPTSYSSHSLRAGAATSAANSGVPPYMIKLLGRWKSDAYQVYVKNPKEGLARAQSLL